MYESIQEFIDKYKDLPEKEENLHFNAKDIGGQTFGRLLALYPTKKTSSGGNLIWLLRCKCGEFTTANTSDLKKGNVSSCGCYYLECVQELGETHGSYFEEDMVGKRFDMLTVLEQVEGRHEGSGQKLWKVECDCGNVKVVDTGVLTGSTQSCGCRVGAHNTERKEDFTDRVIGRLTVIEEVDLDKRGTWWKCLCGCGQETVVSGGNLSHKKTRSCGCLARELAVERGKKYTGENNPNWKGGVTDELRSLRSSDKHKDWANTIKEKDNYTCQKCGESPSGNLVSHHLKPFHSHVDARFDEDAGACLCWDCHVDFHVEYGWREFTPEDFFEYI